MAGRRGGVRVWTLPDHRLLASLPSGRATLRWLSGPEPVLRVVDESIRDWRVPLRPAVSPISLGPGIAGLDLSSDGRRVATAHGDGVARVSSLTDGELQFEATVHDSVVKAVAFSPDGSLLAAGAARRQGVHLFEVDSGTLVGQLEADRPRRLSWTHDGLTVASYGYELRTWSREGRLIGERPRLDDYPLDLEHIAGGSGFVLLDRVGRVSHWDPEHPERDGVVAEVPTAVHVAAVTSSTWLATKHGLLHLSSEGSGGLTQELRHRVDALDVQIDALVISPDGRWLAVGHRDGTVGVWDAARLEQRAILLGHQARVVALDFSDDGRLLASGGWDGDVRTWRLDALDADADELIAELEASWGMDLAMALGDDG